MLYPSLPILTQLCLLLLLSLFCHPVSGRRAVIDDAVLNFLGNGNIFVDWQGRTMVFDYEPTRTIGSLKHEVASRTSIPVAKIRLASGGFKTSCLDIDTQTLSDCGVHKEATLHVVLRLRAGAYYALPEDKGVAWQKYPFVVHILFLDRKLRYGSRCTGTVLGKWVLTAAHCLFASASDRKALGSKWKDYRLQEYMLRKKGRADEVEKARASVEAWIVDKTATPYHYLISTVCGLAVPTRLLVHPGYDPTTAVNDVGLIELPGAGIQGLQVTLDASEPSMDGVDVTLGGFGFTEDDTRGRLDLVTLQTLDCGSKIAASNRCAWSGTSRQTSSCGGDSGGPWWRGTRDGNEANAFVVTGVNSNGFDGGCGGLKKKTAFVMTARMKTWLQSVAPSIPFSDGSGSIAQHEAESLSMQGLWLTAEESAEDYERGILVHQSSTGEMLVSVLKGGWKRTYEMQGSAAPSDALRLKSSSANVATCSDVGKDAQAEGVKLMCEVEFDYRSADFWKTRRARKLQLDLMVSQDGSKRLRVKEYEKSSVVGADILKVTFDPPDSCAGMRGSWEDDY